MPTDATPSNARPLLRQPLSLEGLCVAATERNSQQAVSSRAQASQSGSTP